MTSRVTSFRSSGSSVNSLLLNRARRRVITSAARLPSRMVRRRGFARAIDVRRIGGQHPQAGAGVGDDARQRLVDLMGDRGGQAHSAS